MPVFSLPARSARKMLQPHAISTTHTMLAMPQHPAWRYHLSARGLTFLAGIAPLTPLRARPAGEAIRRSTERKAPQAIP
jgi:hypothetical protein